MWWTEDKAWRLEDGEGEVFRSDNVDEESGKNGLLGC